MVFVLDWPSMTVPKSSGPALSAALAAEPNPWTLPSLVPTYTRPPAIPGMVYLTWVPIGLRNRRLSVPLTGTASYARSSAEVPEDIPDQMTQTSAVPDAVPFDVTTGEPDPLAKGSLALPA